MIFQRDAVLEDRYCVEMMEKVVSEKGFEGGKQPSSLVPSGAGRNEGELEQN